ncbi:MAG TPA: preQ(1) synthase [Rickettsiales bacterium]|nr:preQ(1) synthase [Rickettsiales bacterium]
MSKKKENLGLLGNQVRGFASPEEAVLEVVKNPHPDVDYTVRFTCPEFTSICPITGQPDFAHIVIDYVPGKTLIESKALKLFMGSFRNHGAFHEDCTVYIAKRLIKIMKPKWLRIAGYWYPRGGIPIDIFFQQGKLPEGVWVPETGVAPYKGRG